MSRLRIDLQDGFFDDTVIIRVDRAEVYRNDAVTTCRQVGLADLIELESDTDAAEVDVELPLKALRHTIQVDTSSPAFVGIWLKPSGTITHRIERDPFYYA